MGDELLLTRNQFILGLLKQNFVRVEGPRLEDGENRISYEVWNRGPDPDRDHSVRIAFEVEFLKEPGNDFARTALQVLRRAKWRLRSAPGTRVDAGPARG